MLQSDLFRSMHTIVWLVDFSTLKGTMPARPYIAVSVDNYGLARPTGAFECVCDELQLLMIPTIKPAGGVGVDGLESQDAHQCNCRMRTRVPRHDTKLAGMHIKKWCTVPVKPIACCGRGGGAKQRMPIVHGHAEVACNCSRRCLPQICASNQHNAISYSNTRKVSSWLTHCRVFGEEVAL